MRLSGDHLPAGRQGILVGRRPEDLKIRKFQLLDLKDFGYGKKRMN